VDAAESFTRQLRLYRKTLRGQEGVGPWQEHELSTAIEPFVERGLPVIPVILPTCTKVPELPAFIRTMQRVDYRSLDLDPIEQLVWAITGSPPST